MPYELILKPTFNHQLLAVPREQVPQILDRIERFLRPDPAPRDPVRKKLHGYRGDVYRLRCGDYRVLYTYGNGWICLLGVDARKDVYRGEQLVADEPVVALGAIPDVAGLLQPAAEVVRRQAAPAAPAASDPGGAAGAAGGSVAAPAAAASRALPRAIDAPLLAALHVPPECFPALLACHTEDDLLNASVPSRIGERVMDALFPPDYDRVIEQPSYVLADVGDLLRFKEGELLGFLLRLSREQERYVTRALNASGPTLLRGGPGTGKSTIALYRVRAMLDALRKEGRTQPRILFTTYTNALVAFSRQLLEGLIGDDIRFVDVQTSDSVAMRIAGVESAGIRIATNDELRTALRQAIASAAFAGNALQAAAQRQAVERLSPDYLLEEINGVIEARQIEDLPAYLETAREGRRVALNATQRTAVWQVYLAFRRALAPLDRQTFEQVRSRAEELVRNGLGPEPYDAVIVDEAQDLDPSALRMLVQLCRAPSRIFVTADANQSIYRTGFRWSDVHDQLQFRGRTGVLRVNFRSTREIGEAAHAYLSHGTGGAVNEDPVADPFQRGYAHSGPLPAMRGVRSLAEQSELLVRYLPAAAREWRLGLGACAVLCPTERAGRAIAAALGDQGVPATYMTGKELDLSRPGVKVLTLKSAKGLEFPVVALAGFLGVRYPHLPDEATPQERQEAEERERRTLFVGMTRAMRALLVLVPAGSVSPLYSGFGPRFWNVG